MIIFCIDSIIPKYSIFNIIKDITENKYDIVVMLVRVENIIQSINLINLIKNIYPNIKILLYGDIINFLPNFFKKNNTIDAFVYDGDWEISIISYIEYLGSKDINLLSGVYVNELNNFYKSKNIVYNNREFPLLEDEYIDFYKDYNNQNQLSFTIARGCPYNCKYCFSTCTFGIKDRRKKVDEVIDFMIKYKNKFDSFKLFASTFNADKGWVNDFCHKLIEKKLNISWCATTRIDLLQNEEVIKLLANSGCYKISVGIETLNESSKYLNKIFTIKQIENAGKLFKKYNMTLKGLIMLGVPNQTKEDIYELFEILEKNNIKIRPTSYSPIYKLKENEDTINIYDIAKYDKFTFYEKGITGITKDQYFQLILNPLSYKNILKVK